jgi:hypothetical protein
MVISPYARKGAVIHTRYDQFSFLRTAELLTGLDPLSLNDALATPLYDAFIAGDQQPDVDGTRYEAIQPQQSLTEVNAADAPDAKLSLAMPWTETDLVPQRISDRILWHSVFGEKSTPPGAGPDNSETESDRAAGAMRAYRSGHSARAYLAANSEPDDDG